MSAWRRVRVLVFRMSGLFHGSARDRELAEELDGHLEMHVGDNIRAGLDALEARRRALIALGVVVQTMERYRDQGRLSFVDVVGRDLRYAARVLRKSPAFSLVAFATLSLGIGATTTMFSVVDAVLVKSLPYPEPSELALIWTVGHAPNGTRSRYGSAAPDFRAFRARTHSFRSMGAFHYAIVTVGSPGIPPERLQAVVMTADVFPTLRVQPALGRSFTQADEEYGALPVAIITHGVWQERYGGDPRVAGQSLSINGRAATVIGVLPRGVPFMDDSPRVDVYLPLRYAPDDVMNTRSNHYLNVVARLKAGAGLEAARQDVGAVAVQLAREFKENADQGTAVTSLREELVGPYRSALTVLMGAVALVLLMACANVASLLLARANSRQRELAIRAALGAGRGRIAGQQLVESLLLAGATGAGGLVAAVWGAGPSSSCCRARFPISMRSQWTFTRWSSRSSPRSPRRPCSVSSRRCVRPASPCTTR